ncbi:NAD(P)-dependent oxidoreductase [Fredinandcohnia onubensis]|uniref:NAD(P)-dependent oxidoreductase n=1 Tax=Fredinandcohnia onubensis TaxID=1571209 RepID=UPI000C0BE61A|nr:NAD(P)-dependent oxidoreductase [Fredinandcohnia onubensis]
MTKIVGVVGLGNMGGAIAERLSTSFSVIGFDIDIKKRTEMEEVGVHTVDSLEELAPKVDVLILSMPRADISSKIVSTASPIMKVNSIIVETSTVLPSQVQQMRKASSSSGIRIIDAAILGGVEHMKNKKADLLVGDSDDVFPEVSDVLKAISKDVQLMGGLGAGVAAKIINNGVAHAVMSVIVESAALGVKLGIQPEKIYDLLRGETALLRPLTHRYKERIRNSKYEGGMSTANARKDSTLYLNLAQQLNVPLFSVQGAHTVYEIAQQAGYGDLDYAAIAKLWEKWNDIDFTN